MWTNLELDWLILLGIVLLNLEELEYIEAGYCVHADVVVVDILVKLLIFHEENPVEQFGGENIVVSGGLNPIGAATEGISCNR